MDRRRHPLEAARQVLSLHRDQLVGVGKGHPLEQRAVYDAEHRGRETDAERERENGDGRQRAALPQRSGSVPDVSENSLHGGEV